MIKAWHWIQEVRAGRHALTLFSACLFFALVACGGPQAPQQAKSDNKVEHHPTVVSALGAVSGNGITIEFKKTADWDAGDGARGFTAEVTILNLTGHDIDPWALEFDFLAEISSAWNATHTQSGNRYTVLPEAWNAKLKQGQARSFGFSGTYPSVFQAPTAYKVSGIEVGDQAPADPLVPTCSMTTRFEVTADWSEGEGRHGFVAQVYLTNTGQHPAIWSLRFEADAEIVEAWNASFNPTDDGALIFTPASWNARIEPSETRSFGIRGFYEGSLGTPSIEPCSLGESDVDQITVSPGGSAVGLDGITLDARNAGLDAPVTLTIERVDPDALGLPPLPEGLTAVTDYYRIAHPDGFTTPEGTMRVAVPPLQGSPLDDLRVAMLAPAGSSLHGYSPPEWVQAAAIYLPSSERVAFGKHYFPSDGIIFIVINAQASENATTENTEFGPSSYETSFFLARCSTRLVSLPEACDAADEGLIAMFASEVYDTLHSVFGYRPPSLAFVDDDIGIRYYVIELRPLSEVRTPQHPTRLAYYNIIAETIVIGVDQFGVDEHLRRVVVHEMIHAFQFADPRLGMLAKEQHVDLAKGRWLLEGIAALGELSLTAPEPNHIGHGRQQIGPSLFGEAYKAQDFWFHLLDKSLPGAHFGFFRPFFETTNPLGDDHYDLRLPWDPERVDWVIRERLAVTAFPGGLSEAWTDYVIDAITKAFNDNQYHLINRELLSESATQSFSLPPMSAGIYQVPRGYSPLNAASGNVVSWPPGINAHIIFDDAGDMYLVLVNTTLDDNLQNTIEVSLRTTPVYPGPKSGSSWGDPHLFTFDRGIYTFMATGDYVLVESVDPSDDFVIQVRYRDFQGPTWAHVDSTQWSANEAVAMNIHGDIVEFYAADDYEQPLVVINGRELPSGTSIVPLPAGGSVSLHDYRATATWKDGTEVRVELHTSDFGDWNIAGRVDVQLPASRWNSVRGLMGNNDGLVWNDLQLRDGTILALDPTPQGYDFSSEQLTRELYSGPFRSSWLVSSHESLFTRGVNRFDPFYPSEYISLDMLDPALISIAEAACGLEGVTEPAILSRCVMDVANTGDEIFSALAGAVDPTRPGVTLTPQYAYVTGPQPVEITAHVRGLPSDTYIDWEISEGTLLGAGALVPKSWTPS